jgi:hypothetical protein
MSGLSCEVARRPPPTLVDRVSAQRATPTNTVTVDAGGIPNRRGNLYAHVVAMHVTGTAAFTTATTMAGAFGPSILPQGLLHQFRLIDNTGHVYGENLDGRDLLHDHLTRAPDVSEAPLLAAVLPDEAATPTRDMGWSWYFGRPLPGGRISVRGAIPLASIQARSDALSFRVNNTFPGIPTGVTFNNFGTSGIALRVWFEIVWLKAPVIDHWVLDEYTLDEQSGRLHHCGMQTEYAWLIPRAEDAGGADLVNYAGFTFLAGDQLLADSLTLAEAGDQSALAIAAYDSSCFDVNLDSNAVADAIFRGPAAVRAGGPFQALTTAAPMWDSSFVAYPILLPGNSFMDAPTCELRYNIANMGDHTTNRFLHRVRRADGASDADVSAIRRAMCFPTGAPATVTDMGLAGPDNVGIKTVIMMPEGQ